MLQLAHHPVPEDLNRQFGINAHRGMSFSPEKRADDDIAEYVREVTDFADMCERTAETPEQIAQAVEEVERFRLGYVKHRNAMWSAYSRCMSPMITGPARFPVDRNRKRMDSYDRRCGEFSTWYDNARKAARRNIEKVGEPEREVDGREPVTEMVDGVRIIQNFAIDRLQIVFDGKPDEKTRSCLKSSGWHWSPREGAWQRKLTANAMYSARAMLSERQKGGAE